MLRNRTKNTIIATKIRKLSGLSKVLGLIGKNRPEAVILKTRFGLHTFFMKFPIDVIILDSNNKVVFLKTRLTPNRIFFWNFKFETVIEAAENSIVKSKTEIGDILKFDL